MFEVSPSSVDWMMGTLSSKINKDPGFMCSVCRFEHEDHLLC